MNDVEKLEQVRSELNKLNVQLVEYMTVMRRHIVEEEKTGRAMERTLADHEQRLRDLEEFKTVMASTLPKSWLNPEEIRGHIGGLEKKVDGMRVTLAKWLGIAIGALAVLDLVVMPLLRLLASHWGIWL